MVPLTVVGTGYVGLVTAACFAELGHPVVGVDRDQEKLRQLRAGTCPFYEPGLPELVERHVRSGRLAFTDNLVQGVRTSRIIFICVGTPPLPDGQADLSQVEEVARQIAEHAEGYRLLVEKSTVPVRTAQWIRRTCALFRGRTAHIDVASNPEFLREGSAVHDFLHPDRIVLGVESDEARDQLLKLYRNFTCPVLVTDIATAELIKHASNAFLATKISFINFVADVCERVGGDIGLVAEGMGFDQRIGRAFLNAGAGYGGSCFPKDLKAFQRMAEELGVQAGLLREVDRINDLRTEHLLTKLREALWVINGKIIAILGLAFKPNTDDIREAPSLRLIGRLVERSARLRLYDDQAMGRMREVFPPAPGRLEYAASPLDAARGAEALVLLTEWEEFKHLDFEAIKQAMRTPIIVDGRNLLDPTEMGALGFEYYSMGRPPVRNALPEWPSLALSDPPFVPPVPRPREHAGSGPLRAD